jgi:hypothetical protein
MNQSYLSGPRGSSRSLAACTATVTVTGAGGDINVSNNTTNLVVDVYDSSDWTN